MNKEIEKNVDSIRNIHSRLVREGYQVSEYALRKWVKAGLLPAAHIGEKALISYSAVLRFVEGN